MRRMGLTQLKKGLGTAVALVLALSLAACSADFTNISEGLDINDDEFDEFIDGQVARSSIGTHVYFRADYFYSATEPNTESCGGDARIFDEPYPETTVTTADEDSYGTASPYVGPSGATTGTHLAQPYSANTFNSHETRKPSFLRNISVDLTDQNSDSAFNLAYQDCSLQDAQDVAPASACSRFDYRVSKAAHASTNTRDSTSALFSTYDSADVITEFPRDRYWDIKASSSTDSLPYLCDTPSTCWTGLDFDNVGNGTIYSSGLMSDAEGGGNGTKFYTMLDYECVDAGPIKVGDTETNKRYVGGFDVDVDRSLMGQNENMLLHLTYVPFGSTTMTPWCDREGDDTNAAHTQCQVADQSIGVGDTFTETQTAMFKVYLMSTGNASLETIQGMAQPRHLTNGYLLRPKVVDTLAVLGAADGQIREEQIFVPLSNDPTIDRVRVERVYGSAILVSASVYRMGQ